MKMPDTTTTWVSNTTGFKRGDVISTEYREGAGRHYKIKRVNSDTCITIRPYRWYDQLWEYTKSKANRWWVWVAGEYNCISRKIK